MVIWLLQITVDTTPPKPGNVFDGPDYQDMDYQQSLTIHSTWANFFDKESGILLYKYATTSECLDATDFDPSGNIEVSKTTMYYDKQIQHNTVIVC